jgi:hypothetical protein
MKAILILIVFIYILAVARAWTEDKEECCPCGGERISWEAKPRNPYEDTVIVDDPYKNEDE